jgi:hypothetical protein
LRSDEVLAALLPRAELRDISKDGSVAAIDRFAAAHLGGAIDSEIAVARRAALVRELSEASSAGTLAALDAFVASHPDHHLDLELASARHDVFARALDRYRALAPDDASLAFVARLLAAAEAHGPRVDVVFRRDPSPTLAIADHAVEASNKYAGIVSHPSQWLDGSRDDDAEAELVATLHARFAEAFSPEILDVAAHASLAGEALTVPTIVVAHHVDGSGDVVTFAGFAGVLVAPRFAFDARFVLPDGGPDMDLSATLVVDPSVDATPRIDGAPPPEDAIYAESIRRAFQDFGALTLLRFF